MTDGNYRGLGIASHILRHLVQIAQDSGVASFEADVLAENQSMLAVFRRSGLPMKFGRDGGVLHVTLGAATSVIVGVAMEGIAAQTSSMSANGTKRTSR